MSNLKFYTGYLALSLSITVWVGVTLRRNGRRFLLHSFVEEGLADTVNHLLQVGFYLANFGYIALVIRNYETLRNVQSVLEVGLPKLGGVMLILGLVHLSNLLILSRLRRNTERAPHTPEPRREPHMRSEVLGGPYHLRS